MKHSLNPSALILTAALIVAFAGTPFFLAAQTPPSPAAGTVIFSCDFSTDPTQPEDPQNKWWINTPAQASWAKDILHLGKGSLKLTNPDSAKNVVAYSPFIPYTGPTIHVTVEIKQDRVSSRANKPSISVYYYDQDRKTLSLPSNYYHDLLPLPDGTADWTTYDQTFTFPSSAPAPAFARVVVNLYGSGTIWVDKAILSTTP